jgi:hypothetical protein
MKSTRIILAVIITLGMLYIARTNSRGRPEQVTLTESGIALSKWTVPKITENQSDTLKITLSGDLPENPMVWFRTSQPEGVDTDDPAQYARVEMTAMSGQDDEYFVVVTAGRRGQRFYYYYEVTDSTGASLAELMQPDGQPFLLKYIGEVPPVVLILHILFIFATVFCIAMAALRALPLLTGGGEVRPMAVYLFWATVFGFLGGYPFGIPMNYFAFDGFWEGVPFGTDATDNKTQLLFVYLIFATLSCMGTLTKGKTGRDIYGSRGLGVVGLGAFAVMLFIYLIPHSIQFSPGFTYAFCYAWTGVVALLYVTGYRTSNKSQGAST